jgi:hypothetical protein
MRGTIALSERMTSLVQRGLVGAIFCSRLQLLKPSEKIRVGNKSEILALATTLNAALRHE